MCGRGSADAGHLGWYCRRHVVRAAFIFYSGGLTWFYSGGLTRVYLVYGDVSAVAGILYGVKPAVTAIVVFAYHVLWPRGFAGPFEWFSMLIGVAALAGLFNIGLG